jgi:hypothetical protein
LEIFDNKLVNFGLRLSRVNFLSLSTAFILISLKSKFSTLTLRLEVTCRLIGGGERQDEADEMHGPPRMTSTNDEAWDMHIERNIYYGGRFN